MGKVIYNADIVQFLVQQFKEIVYTYGKTKQAVQIFREQANCLVTGNLNYRTKVQPTDVDFVFRLLGMRKTDSVRWDTTIKRIDQFTYAMNYIVACKNKSERCKCLQYMWKTDKITDTVYRYIMELCDLEDAKKISDVSDYSLDASTDRGYGTFGVSLNNNTEHNVSKRRLDQEALLRKQIAYADMLKEFNPQSLDDFANIFLKDQKCQKILGELNKICNKPEDVYTDLDVCAMFIEWIAVKGINLNHNKLMVNDWINDKTLSRYFKIKNNGCQVFVAAGVCEYYNKVFVRMQNSENKPLDAYKKFINQLSCTCNFSEIMENVWTEPKETQGFVWNLLFNAKIAIPKNDEHDKYYKAMNFIDICNDDELYRQFINCIKSGANIRKLKVVSIDPYLKEGRFKRTVEEYNNYLIKYRLRLLYILKIFDIIRKNETDKAGVSFFERNNQIIVRNDV